MTATHRELSRLAARWLLEQRWCRVAGYEVGGSGDQFDAIGVSRIPDPDINRLLDEERAEVSREWDRRCAEWSAARAEGRGGRRPSYPKMRSGERQGTGSWSRRIVVVEVKRTRSDLLADLRAGKMLGYERVGTSCWLAATDEALGVRDDGNRESKLAELAELGLPSTWGVLRLFAGAGWSPLRNAKHVRQAEPAAMRLWHDRIARSLAHRVTSRFSPMVGEAA